MKEWMDNLKQKRLMKENTKKLLAEEMLDDKRKIIELQDKIISLYECKSRLKQKNEEHLEELKELREKKAKRVRSDGKRKTEN